VVSSFHPFFIFLILISIPTKASFEFTTTNLSAYAALLELKVDKGETLLKKSIAEDPNNGITILLENYADAIRIFLSEDEVLFNKLSKREDQRIKKLQQLDKNSPYFLYTQAEIKMHWAILKLKIGNELSAFTTLRAAYKLLEENEKKFPEFIPTKKSLGLLNVLLGSIPSNYTWALSFLGMEGDIDKGLSQLALVSNSPTPFKLEGLVIQTIVVNYIVHAQEGKMELAKNLYGSNTSNIILTYLYAAILTKNSKGAEALSVIQNRVQDSAFLYFPHIDLLLGELYLYKGDWEKSRNHYLTFLSHFKGKNSLKDTYFKLFLTYWMAGENDMAMRYFTKITSVGKTLYDSDKQAQRLAKNQELPNVVITRIRLYTDGGYFENAFEYLQPISLGQFKTKKDKLEYLYRSARLYHKVGRLNDAITYYEKTIELTKEETYYFAANSALQLGYIHQQANQKEEARTYFTLALSYKNHEYKNSIDNKAKAALNELKK